MNLGWSEILLIGGVVILLFGSSWLPTLAKSIGQAIRELKKSTREVADPETSPGDPQPPKTV